MPRFTGFSRNQPMTCVCAGQLVVISSPATTMIPTSAPISCVAFTDAMVSWSVTAIRSRWAATAALTSSAGLTMPSDDVVWQCGSAITSIEDRTNERGGGDRRQFFDALPHARQLHRHVELGLDCDHGAALRAAVELRQHEACHRDRLVEAAALNNVGN